MMCVTCLRNASWIVKAILLCIFSLAVLGACSSPRSTLMSPTPVAGATCTPTELVAYLPTPPLTPIPTYNIGALNATAEAIASTLPTASPIPGMEPTRQASLQSDDLWLRAKSTAVALYPPNHNSFHWENYTPLPTSGAPTAVVHERQTDGGVLYDDRFIGPP